MKKIFIIFPLIISGCISTPKEPVDPSLKIKIKEFDKDNNGTNEIKLIQTYRDGKKVLAEVINTKDPKNSYRCIYVNKAPAMQENDEDGDGFFETIVIYDKDVNIVELFKRSRNGKIYPASKDELYKKQVISKGLKKSFETLFGDGNDDLETMVRKVKDGIKALEDGKEKEILIKAIKQVLEEEK